jgi:hypothetical protein
MGAILIKCAKTGMTIPTGIAMPKTTFESSSFQNNSFGPCPYCNEVHTWSKEDAWLEGE